MQSILGVILITGTFIVSVSPAEAGYSEAQIRASQVIGFRATPGSEISVELKGAQLDLNDPAAGLTLPKLNQTPLLVESLSSQCVDLMRTAFGLVAQPIRIEITGRLRGTNFVALTPVVKFESTEVQCSLVKSP